MLLYILVFLIPFSLSVNAQQPTGSITGVVGDASGAVIPGAGVSLTRQATGMVLQLTTLETGMYTFGSLLPGTYQIKVGASGFKTAVLDLLVEVGRVTAGDLRRRERRIRILPLSGGEVHEVVIKREIQMSSLDWASDGRGFFVGTINTGGRLLFVDMDGHTEVLWKTAALWGLSGTRGLPSPDGLHLAMLGRTADSNVWMLDNF